MGPAIGITDRLVTSKKVTFLHANHQLGILFFNDITYDVSNCINYEIYKIKYGKYSKIKEIVILILLLLERMENGEWYV